MEPDVYRELMYRSLMEDPDFQPVEIPVDPLPGETIDDAGNRWLLEQGILYEDEDGFKINKEKADAYDPNLYKILEVVFMPEVLSVIDDLQEEGFIWQSVDDQGNSIYGLTEKGHNYLEETK